MNRNPYQRVPYGHPSAQYRNQPPLTNQVPNLNHYPHHPQEERIGILPFVGGLALGGLLFSNWGGCNGGGCGGYYPVPVPTPYYQQPVFPGPGPAPYYQQPGFYPYQPQNQFQSQYQYQPYNQAMASQATIVENNKFYLN